MLLGSRKGQIDRGRKTSKRRRPRRSTSAPAVMLSDITNKRRKRWTNESMCAAIQSVEDGSSVSQAARAHGVPYTTLYDRIAGNVTSCQESSQSNSSVIQSVTPPEHDGELNFISKCLIQYVPTKKTVNTGKCATGARVLTSDECAKIIFEKEEKKRREQEEKEARKAERELKKKEKEEAAKKKAEETAKRKEEAAKKKGEAAKKKQEAAKKKAEAARKKDQAAKQREETFRKKGEVASTRPQVAYKRSRTHAEAISISKRQKISVNADDDDDATIQGSEFDENQCCVCFRTYDEDQLEETGLLWVQCVCRRWIHEDCYENVLIDKNGRGLICPYCVM